METAKFVKGDRVRLIADSKNACLGQMGTVLENDSFVPWVQFDLPTGTQVADCGGQPGYCDCVPVVLLQRLECDPVESSPAVDKRKPPLFKKGARVRLVVDSEYASAGQTGTVLESDSFVPWVQFDLPTSLQVTACGGKTGFCAAVLESNMELLDPVSTPPDDTLLQLLIRAIKRVEIANEEGDCILSAWVKEAKSAVARVQMEHNNKSSQG